MFLLYANIKPHDQGQNSNINPIGFFNLVNSINNLNCSIINLLVNNKGKFHNQTDSYECRLYCYSINVSCNTIINGGL